MKVSLNIIKNLINFELPAVDELVARVNAQLGGVEEVVNIGARYKDAKIVRVVECEKHPNADKLSVCKIDVGENDLVQVVCGAPNVHANMWAVWLPPSSIVPSTFGDAEPFKLAERELRGVMSRGMLAAGDELGINNDHDGIVEITDYDLPPNVKLEPGTGFAKTFGLDDYVIDIENKMFTHRPDLFGQLGVAREIAGIFHQQFESPKWYQKKSEFKNLNTENNELELGAFNEATEKAPRAMFVAMRNVEVRPSPLWLQCALVAMGSKPINNVVDATNYVMLMTAQPTHAYDYDKIRSRKIGVRMAKSGEKIKLINEKDYELDESDIVIADGEGAIGLAGIMGGLDSEVTDQTRNIVLEVANFDMYTLRRSSMRHGLFTDALARFNKGQSPLQTSYVMGLLMDMIDAVRASEVYDIADKKLVDSMKIDELYPPLTISPQFIRDRLGADLSKYDMATMLRNVEFPMCEDCGWDPEDKEDEADDLHVNIPFWRTDIELPEDIVEEVGRLYSFDKLPRELPMRNTKPASKNTIRQTKQMIRQSLKRAGVNEVLTYSFVHENIMKKSEQDASQAFKLSNALSPDLQYYRLSVLPSLLDKVHANIKSGHDEFCLFEIGKGHNKKYHANDDDGLPRELNFVDAVYASKNSYSGAPYFYVRHLVSQLARDFGFTLKFTPIVEPLDFPVTAPFDQKRSAIVETRNGQFIGMVGELKQSVIKNFKLPTYVAAITLDLEGLQKAIETPRRTYAPLSKYPSIFQDISLKVPSTTSYEDVFHGSFEAARKAAGDIDIRQEPISIYQSDNDKSTKTITLRLKFTSHEKTLKDSDVAPIMDAIDDKLRQKLNAERV